MSYRHKGVREFVCLYYRRSKVWRKPTFAQSKLMMKRPEPDVISCISSLSLL